MNTEKGTESTLTPDEERIFLHLRKLAALEEFRTWVLIVAEPLIQQLEAELRDPLKYSEVDLKSRLLQLNSLKYIFREVFEIARQYNVQD